MAIPGTLPFDSETIPQALVAVARRKPEAPFLRFVDPRAPEAPPRRLTFGELERAVRRGVAFLRRRGVTAGDRLLFFAENGPEWQVLSLAAQALRAEPAALFAQLGSDQACAVARRVGPRVAVVSDAAQWAKLLGAADALVAAGLTTVVAREPIAPAALREGVRAFAYGEILDGAAPEITPAELDALAGEGRGEDPFLLLFTSGTTGRPKGVRLPQRAIMRAIEGGRASTAVTEEDDGLHFLPFGHVAGHDHFMLALAQGHRLVMVARREDVPRGLALGPTYLFSVPLLYERIRGEIEARLARVPRALRPVGRLLARRALRRRLGGRVRALFSGGASAAPGLAAFFESFGLPFVELYGMSETAGLISSNLLTGPRRPGSAGYLSSHLEARLEPDGELCVRGGTLMTGYLDQQDEEGAFTPDGFFRTGDLVRFAEDGTLRVEGRKKSLLVLSTGKKLSPEPIEQVIAATSPFTGAVLLGDGRPFVTAAVFVPKPELARLAAAGRDAAVELLATVRGALASFSEYEKPKRVLVIPGSPDQHPALVTPTLKVKRDAFLRWAAAEVEALYASSFGEIKP
jgi:long-chain acyl-CoA synthetase